MLNRKANLIEWYRICSSIVSHSTKYRS